MDFVNDETIMNKLINGRHILVQVFKLTDHATLSHASHYTHINYNATSGQQMLL